MTQMDGRFVLISGSASHTCSDDRLKVAIRFVESFTEEALKRGGGFVVLAGAEESAKNGQGTPLIFDWLVPKRPHSPPPRCCQRNSATANPGSRNLPTRNLFFAARGALSKNFL